MIVAILFILELIALVASVLLLWAILSPLFYGLCWVIERAGIRDLLRYRHLAKLRRFLRWPKAAYGFARSRLPLFEGEPSMRVVIDQRLTILKQQILVVRTAIERACDKITQFGRRRSSSLLTDVSELQRKTEEVALLGGTIDENLVKDYQLRKSSTTNLLMGTFFLLVFALGNGIFINQFMRSLINVYFMNVPISLVISIIIVAVEAGSGWLVAIATRGAPRDWNYPLFIVGLICILVLATFEASMIGLVSAGLDFDVDLFVTHPNLRYWMAPLGIAFAFTTAGISYSVHKFADERAATRGALKLRREIKQANTYVRGLPARWESIRDKAFEATAALNTYKTVLGARDGESAEDSLIGGLVNKVTEERHELTRVFALANVSSWVEVIAATKADERREAVRNVGILAVSAVAWVGVCFLYKYFLALALSDVIRLPEYGWYVLALTFETSVFWLGFHSFQRLHNIDGPSGRAYPYRHSPAESFGGILVAVSIPLALLWCTCSVFGPAGILFGAALVAFGAMLAGLGYHFERSCRAARMVAFLSTIWGSAGSAAAGGYGLFLLGWFFGILFWTLWVAIRFLGLPMEVALKLYEKWKIERAEENKTKTVGV